MIKEDNLRIFVEGKADIKFLKDLIRYRFKKTLSDNIFIQTNGWTRLYEDQNIVEFQRMQDNDGKSLVIFDADNDFVARKEELLKGAIDQKIIVTKDDIFLFPSNYEKGDLESLLLSIANRTSHQSFFSCFDNYLACLGKYEKITPTDLNIPDRKTYVYAYLSTHKQEGKEEKRNYADIIYWDLDHPILESLVNFLEPFCND